MSGNRSMIGRMSRRVLLGTALALGLAFGPAAEAQMKNLEIIVPANPGGGWDQTGRAIQAVLDADKLSAKTEVVNIGGAGGTIGLAQFVTSKKRRGDSILVSGLVMVGAIITNKPPVTLDDVTPLARLTGEYEALVVPANSPIQSMDDLMAKLKADPGSVSWGGGSAGGTDHILAALIAKTAGIDGSKVNYIAHSGGGEALSSILGGHVTVGVSGLQEFVGQIQAGQLRALAISADEPVAGLDIKTLKQQGVDVSLVNWRGLFAPPQIRDADLKVLAEAVDTMVKSEGWKSTLAQRGWIDMYQPPATFKAFLAEDQAKVESTLKDLGLAN